MHGMDVLHCFYLYSSADWPVKATLSPGVNAARAGRPLLLLTYSSFNAFATSPHATYLKFCGPSGKRL